MSTHTSTPASPETQSTLPRQVTMPLALLMAKTLILSVAFVTFFMLLSMIGLSLFAWRQLTIFMTTAHTTPDQIWTLATTAWSTPPLQTQGHKTILLLGLDALANRTGDPVLTDTMMLISLNLETGKVAAISLPRDLWSDAYQTKINALYWYGQDRQPDQPHQFPTQVLAEMADISIDHTVVVSLEDVAAIVDLVGGLPITIPNGFVDEQFPRSDVDIHTIRDPKLLYETVVFEAGPQRLSGEDVLKYVRSRHGSNGENTDEARTYRQRLVIESLFTHILSPAVMTQPVTMGNLYLFYQKKFAQFWSLTDLLSTGKALLPHRKSLALQSQTLSLYPDQEQGVLEHPPVKEYQNQWVYVIRNEQTFRQEIRRILYNE